MTTVEKHTDDDEVGLEHAEEFARTHPGLVKFGRVGWVAKGVVYALTGFLALLIAFDRLPGAESTQSPGQEASQSGAIARIGTTSRVAAAEISTECRTAALCLSSGIAGARPGSAEAKTIALRGRTTEASGCETIQTSEVIETVTA